MFSPRTMRRLLPAGFAALLVAAPSALGHLGHGTEEVGEYDLDAPRTVSPETAKHIGLATEEVDFRSMEETLELSGTVKPLPDRQFPVVPLVEGQVAKVHVQVGDTVKAGDVLVEIESLAYLEKWARLAVFKANAEVLEADRKAAADELARAQSLGGEAIPAKEIAARRAALAKADADLRLAEIERGQAVAWIRAVSGESEPPKEASARFPIRSAMSGVVVEREARPGQWAEAGRPLLQVADYSTVLLEGELPESLIARVRARASDKVRIRTPADPAFLGEGRVRYIAPTLDPVKRTAHLLVEAPNPRGVLRGEMWVDLSVVLRGVKSAVAVPRSAVVVQGPMHFVFVRVEAAKHPPRGSPAAGEVFQKRDIVPGISDDRFVEVKDGLAPGDVVVVQGTYSLTQLQPKKGPEAGAPGKAPASGPPRKPGPYGKE